MGEKKELDLTECNKLNAKSVEYGVIMWFLEDLNERGIVLCRIGQYDRFSPIPDRNEGLAFYFLGIDANKLEAERRALLESLR